MFFHNISVKSWWSVLLVEEIRVPWENHRLVNQWWTVSHKVVSNTLENLLLLWYNSPIILWLGHHFCNKNWPDKRGDLQQFACILLSQCIWNLARSEGMTFDERGLIRGGLMFRFYTRATMEDNNYYPFNN